MTIETALSEARHNLAYGKPLSGAAVLALVEEIAGPPPTSTERARLRPIFNEPITRADVVEDADGVLRLIIKTEAEAFEVPVLQTSVKGFRTDLIGQRIVIGLLEHGEQDASDSQKRQ